MRKTFCTIVTVIAALALLGACDAQRPAEETPSVGLSTKIEGDTTLYGLACDGCTDTVLVFLPGKGGDPITFNILEATRHRRIIGRPQVGDWVAVIRNGEDSTQADMVIDLDQLKGSWVTKVLPTPRERIAELDSDSVMVAHRDSMLRNLMVPVEMGFALKRHYTAQAIGSRRTMNDDDSPVIYPRIKRYSQWHVINGQLVLTEKIETPVAGTDSMSITLCNDTADFVFMLRDSLRLRFADGERGYYRKTNATR